MPKKGAVGASKRYPLKRIKCVGGPCKTLKLSTPYPERITLGQGSYYLKTWVEDGEQRERYEWLEYRGTGLTAEPLEGTRGRL